jgi:tetratricopeptide (TPR) repeat protein
MDALNAGVEAGVLPLLDAARAFHPRDARLWQATGLVYRALRDLAPAVSAFEKAALLAPRDALIAHSHARAAFEAGLPSIWLFERALTAAPLDEAIMLGLAAALNAEHGPAAAIEILEERVREHPGRLPGHALLARLRCMSGERDRMTESFEQALELAPGDIPLWRELISILMHAELWPEALAAIGRARELAGPHLAFDVNEAACIDEMGEHEKAAPLFEAFAGIDDVSVVSRRVRNLLRLGSPDRVITVCEPWTAGPNAGPLWPFISAAWRLLGDPRWQWLEGDERQIGIYDLADRLPPLHHIAARLRDLHVSTHQPLEQSVRGGTQTDSELFCRIEPELRALRRVAAETVERHIAQLPPPEAGHPTLGRPRNGPVRFSGSWSVRLTGGGRHAPHFHPAGWLSSALYVALPDEKESGGPNGGWLALGEPPDNLGFDLPPTRLIEPKPGRLVLFPSTMWHGTKPFAAGERLTVAFDVAPMKG